MVNRREFLQTGLAGMSAPFVACSQFGVTGDPYPFYTSVYDVRYDHSVLFAMESQRLGGRIDGIEDDIMPVLDGGLSNCWQKEAICFAGVTRFAAFYYFERLASNCGHCVLYHGEHVYDAYGHVKHTLTGPALALGAAQNALLAGEQWGHSIAHVIRLISSVDSRIESISVATKAPNTGSNIGHLESWIIGKGN